MNHAKINVLFSPLILLIGFSCNQPADSALTNLYRFLVVGGVLIVFLASCNIPPNDECPPSEPSSFGVVPEDSVCLGQWYWSYTIEYHEVVENNWVFVDTIYPGDPVVGFDFVNECSVRIDDRSICVRIDDQLTTGCYSIWESELISIGNPNPSYLAVSSHYTWQSTNGPVFFTWGVRLIGEGAYNISRPPLPYDTYDSTKPTYEGSTGIRYVNIFAKEV